MPVASNATLLKSRLGRFERAIDGIDDGDVKALHRTRVASRRLREIVPVLQLDRATAKKLVRRLRKVTKRLGSVRELDVLLLLIDELHVSRPMHAAALGRVAAAVTRTRNEARRKLRSQMPETELERLARKLGRAVEELDETAASSAIPAASRARALLWAVDARTANRAARLGAAVEAAGAVYLPERLHAVRIAVKKLRYALELASELRGDKRTPALTTLKRVQALLGRLHDLQVLIASIREAQAGLVPASVAVWRELDDLVTMLEDMCRRLHARYVRERAALDAVVRALSSSPAAGRPHAERRAG
jgi:CHAD domain-containing protein